MNTLIKFAMEWALNKASEKSTWVGVAGGAGYLASLGLHLSADQSQAVAGVIVAIASAALVWVKEANPAATPTDAPKA